MKNLLALGIVIIFLFGSVVIVEAGDGIGTKKSTSISSDESGYKIVIKGNDRKWKKELRKKIIRNRNRRLHGTTPDPNLRPTPEPATLFSLGAGLVTLAVVGRKWTNRNRSDNKK